MLLLLPSLTLVAAEYGRDARGPFFYGPNQDPSYSYLAGALSIGVQGKTAFFDHPGLTIQGIGAAVLAVTHAASNRREDLPRDVLSRPELYLRAIQLTILAAVVSALAIAGFLAWRGGDPVAAVLLQTSPWLSALSLAALSQVGPESTLVLAAVALSAAVWRFATVAPRDELAFAVAFGAITAFALATRISALSFVLVPLLLLRSWRGRLGFAATTAAGGGLALLVVDQKWRFLATILFHGRRTGSGYRSESQSLLDPNLYSDGIASLYDRHQVFFAVIGLALVVWLWHLRRGRIPPGLYHRALGAVLAGQAAQVLLVSKTPVARYLLPATLLAALALALTWAVVNRGRRMHGRWRAALAVPVLVLPVTLELPRHLGELDRLRRGVEGQRSIAAEISRLPGDCTVAEFFRASSLPYALHFGRRQLPGVAGRLLADIYPREIFYNHYGRTFEGFTGLIPASEVARQHSCLALHGHFRPDLAPLLIRQTPVESLYAVPSVDAVVTLPTAEPE